MSLTYRHSGGAPLASVALMFLAGLAAAVGGAFVYAYGVDWIPIVQVSFLLTGGYGFLIGGVIAWRAKEGHVRTRLVPAVAGLICGVVGVYVAWGATFLARHGWDALDDWWLAFDPRVLAGYIDWLYEHNGWGLGRNGNPVTGIPLAIVWALEGLVIVGIATIFPWSSLADLTYCEKCSQWCEPDLSDLPRLAITDANATDATPNEAKVDDLKERLATGDIRPLFDWPTANPDATEFVSLSLIVCVQCREAWYLTVKRVKLSVDKQGEVKQEAKTLVDRLSILRADAERLTARGQLAEA